MGKILSEVERCWRFLKLNGWELTNEDAGDDPEYLSFVKQDCYGIDMNSDEMVFIDEQGDFARVPTSYYALIGALLEFRQIGCGYISVPSKV